MTGREAAARWRANNPERNRANNSARKIAARQRVAKYKSARGCETCGITDARVLDLHHRNSEEKVLAVSQMLYRSAWAAVVAEMEKCRVLCANCHRIEHADDSYPRSSDVQMTGATFFRAS